MAILDTENNQIVIRLIYDGSPLSGKTTSLRTLAGGLAQNLYTPEEVNGRTTYFDWVDYTGGLFEGYQIRCQIASVPGQEALTQRRKKLIESADVIVFVGDTTRDRLPESLSYLRELRKFLRDREGPPVGIIFQANKRDLGDAVNIEEIQKKLDEHMKSIAIVESVATEGAGIRHAFVFAVRLCLDRVRELIRNDSLPHGKPEAQHGEDLLNALKASEEFSQSLDNNEPSVEAHSEVAENTPAAEALHTALGIEQEADEVLNRARTGELNGDGLVYNTEPVNNTEEEAASADDAERILPKIPTEDVPGGMIWPPVEGRIILHEVTVQNPRPVLMENGDWESPPLKRWRIHSYAGAAFSDLQEARQLLIHWVHLHLAVTSFLSSRRCLILNENGDGRWRLWQVIRIEKTLRHHLDIALARKRPEKVAEGIWGTAYILVTAAQRFSEAPCPMTCRLDSISYKEPHILYNGLMPDMSSPLPLIEVAQEVNIEELIQSQMAHALEAKLAKRQNIIAEVIDYLNQRADNSDRSQRVLESISNILKNIKA